MLPEIPLIEAKASLRSHFESFVIALITFVVGFVRHAAQWFQTLSSQVAVQGRCPRRAMMAFLFCSEPFADVSLDIDQGRMVINWNLLLEY